MPQHDAVVAITSGTRDMASVMNVVWDRLIPALDAKPLPADTASDEKLKTRLARLTLRPESSVAAAPMTKAVVGHRYTFPTNSRSIEAITFDSIDAGGVATFTVKVNGDEQRLTAGSGAWRNGVLKNQNSSDPVAISGGWTADDTYTLKVVRYRTPFITTYRLRFSGDQLTVDSEENVGAADTRTSSVVGTLDHTTSR